MIVDVRCSPQYSKSQDSQGSESVQRLHTFQKEKKQIEGQIEVLKQKESILRDVLVAYASSANFDFSGGLDSYDEKKVQVRKKKDELEEELAVLEKKIREAGGDESVSQEHQMTASTLYIYSSTSNVF